MMVNAFIQTVKAHRGHGATSLFRHWGALGLFSLAIIDSSPLPTFSGPDILTAILAATHRSPWYEYAAMATAGSVIGAYLTFRIARRAGSAYLQSKFGHRKLDAMLGFFNKWGTAALAVSTAVPFPSPTSLFFAAAGASKYSTRRFLIVVTVCRSARYTLIAVIAEHYGRRFIHVLRHPSEYWAWLLLFAAAVIALVLIGIALNRRLASAPASEVLRAPQLTPRPLPGSGTSPQPVSDLPRIL
jgi:membrane protein YqaA with SNARE-associated domain